LSAGRFPVAQRHGADGKNWIGKAAAANQTSVLDAMCLRPDMRGTLASISSYACRLSEHCTGRPKKNFPN
jgi:hypothetical protein